VEADLAETGSKEVGSMNRGNSPNLRGNKVIGGGIKENDTAEIYQHTEVRGIAE
jgi:hypothetical protein